MARNSDPRARIDRDGVRTATRPGGGAAGKAIAGVVFAVLVALAWLARDSQQPETRSDLAPSRTEPSKPSTEQHEEWASVKQVTPRRAAAREAEADKPNEAPPPEIDARDVIPALVEAGETGGIAAFPPPGTKPVKRGIVVPDDYQLPPGYVRHYQATDDGKGLEPILMFSPDYEFLDQNGKRIAVPDDLVVPPELAPAGLADTHSRRARAERLDDRALTLNLSLRSKSMFGQAAAIVASALAFGLYSRVEWPWMLLGWVGLVPWLAVLDRTRSTRASLFAGLAMCVAFSLSVFGWFADAIAGYAETSRGLAWLLLALGAPALQPQLVTFALARRALRRDLGIALGTVGAALVYVGTEWAWPKLFADTLGHGLHASASLRQGADLAGAAGLTFVVLLVNECLCFAATHYAGERRRAFRAIACAAGIVLALALYGHARLEALATTQRRQHASAR